MSTGVERLVDALLYEGYALYPYTPTSQKNATPTPFGIVYPPAYAAQSPHLFDRLQVECLLADHDASEVSTVVRFLQSDGEGHRAIERRVALTARPGECRGADVDFPPLRGRLTLTSMRRPDGRPLVRVLVENRTPFCGEDRPAALEHALLSTHVVVHAGGARFVSPLEADGCENVNTWPVLATSADDTILAAAIFLPDHPRIAPQSQGDLFDGTEIEEALVLHVQTLSDEERAAIAAGDERVQAMIARADAVSSESLLGLHGAMAPPDPSLGEREATVDGVVYRAGIKVVLRPAEGADAYDVLLVGRTATVERIYVDYDDRVHLAVTVDDDPAQELLRDSGRFLFFRAEEVEVVAR
jgi:hypothetical protein